MRPPSVTPPAGPVLGVFGVMGVLGVLGVRGVLGFAVDFFAVACVPPGESLMMSAGAGVQIEKRAKKLDNCLVFSFSPFIENHSISSENLACTRGRVDACTFFTRALCMPVQCMVHHGNLSKVYALLFSQTYMYKAIIAKCTRFFCYLYK